MPVNTTIRMYNQLNLGDCFLLKFKPDDGDETFMLIDFGSYHTNPDRERVIAENIRATVQGKKLTIVLTHQHKDHLSGFSSSKDLLKGLSSELWLSFLDKEQSPQGKIIRETTEKYWNKSKKVKKIIEDKFKGVGPVKKMVDAKLAYDLFAEGQTGGKSVTDLLELTNHNVNFLTPGESFFLPGTNNGVKVYVLGPPYDDKLLRKLDPNEEEEVSGLNAAMELANLDISSTLMLNALESYDNDSSLDLNFPFNKRYQQDDSDQQKSIIEKYEKDDWRKIDYDWLSEIGRLSLHMDNLTNNTSLVLAFELIESKKVLFFVGDAQIGNWKSWFNVKFTDDPGMDVKDLLSRTVFYKAGHHSSHNATLIDGLNLMNEKELIIMIPVNEKVSTKHKFAMLKSPMLMGYHRKSMGRVLRSDIIEQPGDKFALEFPFAKREDFAENLIINKPDGEDSHLSMDLIIRDKKT